MASEQDLLLALNQVVTALWNSSVSMDNVAEDCKLRKGEALIDRVETCGKSMVEWSADLDKLNSHLNGLEKLLGGFKNPKFGSPASIAATTAEVSRVQHASMKKSYDSYFRELNKHKATLRKVKV